MLEMNQQPGKGYFYLKVTGAQEAALVDLEQKSRWLWITFLVEKAGESFADPQTAGASYYCIGTLYDAGLERPGLVGKPSGTEGQR